MKKTIIFSLITGFILVFSSCDKKEKDYSEADAVYKKIVKTYTLNEDGSVDYHYQHELDIHSYYAFNSRYGESFIVYNPDYQELTINKSVTTMADGKEVESPDNAYNEVLPRMASGAPPYSHLREMVVTHTGLEKNSTINLDYELKSEKEFIPFLMENEILAQTSPVKELIVKVEVPENYELNYKVLNAKEDLNIAREGSTKEYQWVFKNIKPISDERNQPEFDEHLPRLIFSTKNFTEAYQYLTNEISYNLPEKTEEKVNNIFEDTKTEFDTIRAIQKMVVNQMNHFDVPLKYSGHKLKDNQKVLENNGGNTEEKTVLLASLLQEQGFEAQPVAIIPENFFNEDIGNPKTIEKYFVKVKHNNENIYLSAIEDNKSNELYKLYDANNVILDNEKPEFVEANGQNSHAKYEGEFTMNKDFQLEGELKADLTYNENPYLTIKDNEEASKSLLNPVFTSSDIKELKINKVTPEQSIIDYTVETNVSPQKQEDYHIMKIPEFPAISDISQLNHLVSERNTPLGIEYPVKVSYAYTINKSEDIKLTNNNIKEEKENASGKVSVIISSTPEEITVTKELIIKDSHIPESEYSDFFTLITTWNKKNHKELIFKEVTDE
ncbi:MAG: DUF3857 domain-containing protein [Bacteroidales bacterium]